jgi:predicted ATPase
MAHNDQGITTPGCPVRKVFISYARQNKPDVEQLVEHLRVLGCETWHDASLRGGQDWWNEIVRRIADCDTFIAVISRDALSSTACRREIDWAESLGKPVMPVAVEPPPKALPWRFSRRQIVDYSDRESRDRAALTLAGGLATLPGAPPLPDPLPEPPAAPLSYLTDLVDLVSQSKRLDHAQQRTIVHQLERALRSVDPDERQGGRDILEMLSRRDDRPAEMDQAITKLRDIANATLVNESPASITAPEAGGASTPMAPASLRTSKTSDGGHLPVQLTTFVGRRGEINNLRQLASTNRLVTLTGAGGVGKTRLAVELARQLADAFGGEAWWVDLAPITDPALVAVALARTLKLPDQTGSSTMDNLLRFIGERQMLVVLDNCEHLLDACAALLVALFGACPGLKILATSREPIGVAGEVTWSTPSLSLTDDAVELFADRARLARPDFDVADNAAVVAEICQRLDGVPLAIELAAARVRSLSLDEIIDGLHDRFRLLTGGARTAVPRQQTLRASVDWSHELLGEPERVVLRRLAVFMGGFDLHAAHAVAGDAEAPPYQIRDELSSLVDKSLVVADVNGHDTRYRLLEMVRQYAVEKLDESGEADMVHTRHRDHYTALFDAPASGSHQQQIELAEVEIDNLRAAFEWSRENGDSELALRLASALQPLWLRGRALEGLAWFDGVLVDDPALAAPARAGALADKALLDFYTGDFFRVDLAEHALAIARELDDPALLARALLACGAVHAFNFEVALPFFAEAIELARSVGDEWRLAQILAWQAYSAFFAGDPVAACAAAEEGRDLSDAIGNGFQSRLCRWCIGMARWISADLVRAAAELTDVAADAQEANDSVRRAGSLVSLGHTLAYLGDTSGARAAAQVAIELTESLAGVQQSFGFGALANACLAAGDVAAAAAATAAGWDVCAQPMLLAILTRNIFPMAEAALARGELSEARCQADQSVSATRGAHRMIALATRVRVALAQGDLERAGRDAHDALTIAGETKAYLTIPDVIECLAAMSAASGKHREAARLLGSAQAIRGRTGEVRFKIYDRDHDSMIDSLREAMGHKAFDTAWADGAALSPDDAVSVAQPVISGDS